MMKLTYTTAVALLTAAVLSGSPVAAQDVRAQGTDVSMEGTGVPVERVGVSVERVRFPVEGISAGMETTDASVEMVSASPEAGSTSTGVGEANMAATEKPASARLEKRGKALAKNSATRKRSGYKVSSSSRRTTRFARTGTARLRGSSHVAKNAAHKETGTYKVGRALGMEKGSLPWPVDSRKISMHFGLQNYNVRSSVSADSAHANDVDYVKIDNLGIVIEAGKGAIVKAVLDGVIDDVMDIGGGVAILIKHDKYFFIYSDLSATVVTKGQQVTAGTILGVVGDEGQLDFRLYDAGDVWLDPEVWLEQSALKK